MNILRKISDIIYKTTGVLITIGLAIIVVLVFAQVISRYVFSYGIAWAQELTVYTLIWLVFLGCSMGMRDGKVVALSFVMDRMPQKVKDINIIIVNVILIAFFVLAINANREIISFGMKTFSPVLNIQKGYIFLAFTISAIIMIFNCLIEIINVGKSFFERRKGGTDR